MPDRKRLTPRLITKIHTLATQYVKKDGTPNKQAIAKRVNKSPQTIARCLNGYRPIHNANKPKQEDLDKANKAMWQDVKRDVYPNMGMSMRNLASRLASSSGDMDYDARDLRHLSQAVDTAYKTLALASGDVTSRTKTEQSVDKTVTHRVIRVPEKAEGAFIAVDGTKEIGESYETLDDQEG